MVGVKPGNFKQKLVAVWNGYTDRFWLQPSGLIRSFYAGDLQRIPMRLCLVGRA